jgi:CBS domain-containing protein
MGNTVGDVMTRVVVWVRPFTPYKDIARLLVENEIGALPVLDDVDRVCGVVSSADLIEKEAGRREPAPGSRETRGGAVDAARAKERAASAAALMTGPAVTIGPDAGLAAAAALMVGCGVAHLPVVDAAGRLVGIVSRTDLLTPYLRPDLDIQDEITREVLLHARGVRPRDIRVRVRHGVATLTGAVETDEEASEFVRLARAVDGVVEAVDKLNVPRVEDAA